MAAQAASQRQQRLLAHGSCCACWVGLASCAPGKMPWQPFSAALKRAEPVDTPTSPIATWMWRVRALARRAVLPLPPVLVRGDVTLDSARRVAFRGERRLELSPKEFALLECLLALDGGVISAEQLLARVWDEAADPFTTTVKTTIGRLRAKLGDPPVIETVRERGYRI